MNSRVVLFCTWFCVWKRPGLPPIESTIIPGEGFKGSPLGLKLAWGRRSLKRFRENQKSAWLTGFTDRRSALLRYARSIGFPVRMLEGYNWPPPFTYRELPVLSMTAKELDFPHKLRPDYHHIGPMVKADRTDGRVDPEVRSKIDGILKDCRENAKTLIHLAATSMHGSDAGFVKRVIKAVASRPDWVLVAGLGHASTVAQLGDLPDNVHVFERIPQLTVLKAAACSIHHGGINSINECIAFRVPMLVYSGGMFDQNGCAARVAYHGIGQRGERHTDGPERIQQRIRSVIGDSDIREKIDRVAKRYEAGGHRSSLKDLLNGFLIG